MNSGNSRSSLSAGAVPPVVHDARGDRVERGRHEVAAVVGEQAGVVDRAERRRRFEAIALPLRPGSSRRSSTCRSTSAADESPASTASPSDGSSAILRDESARYAARTPASRRSDRMRSASAPPWNSTRCARLNGYATMPAGALLGLAEDDRLVDQRPVRRRPCRARSGIPPLRYGTCPADDAPVPAVRLVEVEHLRGGVLEAEVAAEAGSICNAVVERVIAEHVAELNADAAADGGAEAVGAHGDASAAPTPSSVSLGL